MKIWVKISSNGKIIDKANSKNQAKEKEIQNLLTNKDAFVEYLAEIYAGWELAEMIFEKNTEKIYINLKHDLDIEYLGWQKLETEDLKTLDKY